MWSRTDLDHYRWSGLLRPEQALERANLLLIRPYEPNKIPVVMVHGLISTPLAWIPMLNELLRDPAIQDNYQFLLYMYPTGVPIPIAAANLRDCLIQAKQLYDPDGPRPGLRRDGPPGAQHGRSLEPHHGGFQRRSALAALFRPATSKISWARARFSTSCASYFFFEPLPFVSRVVFLATPHRRLGHDAQASSGGSDPT